MADLQILLLAFLSACSHRAEKTLVRRFGPRVQPALASLLVDGFIEFHSLSPRAWRITMAGRSALRRARERAVEKRARAAA